ncbi:MAG: beta-galactosidase [Anaerolineae bacterium]|nr:beta-galactosidase [Anaerolineae bacterium]
MPEFKQYPFLFGAQYYRAPTPESASWSSDLARMARMGFNAVKYWVQWRWSHRSPDNFYFDDLDTLMDLAQENNLKVTLNIILDVAPLWLYQRYPDAKQVMADGSVVEPMAVGHRQIGGHPGPCYHHPGALESRQHFMNAVVDHFKDHPALSMWDVWNEPELCFPQRTPHLKTLVCYCNSCKNNFLHWLQEKYITLAALNKVWGRCYGQWSEVELPLNPHTFTDFVDWREFHIDTMTGEAQWRLKAVKRRDSQHPSYLHVVPNVMSIFNAVTCAADDFAMADACDVFAATMNGGPIMASQVISAAREKVVYNVESHVNHGCTSLHQRFLGLKELLHDFLPQIGLGIRGFLFWQYRPETLGFESPGWGLTHLDGSDRPITQAAFDFWSTLRPYVDRLMASRPTPAQIGIWKSRKNEIFHYAMYQSFHQLVESVEGYINALYWQSLPFTLIDHRMLEQGELHGLKLLIMPSPYYLTEAEACQLDRWVRSGGVLLSDAHLGGYNATTGRHSGRLPGCGLADSWGICEMDSTATYHLSLAPHSDLSPDVTADVRKALHSDKLTGGAYIPICRPDGSVIWGAQRYARLGGTGLHSEGYIDEGAPCMVRKIVGNGRVYYNGTNLGQGAVVDSAGLMAYLREVAHAANVEFPIEDSAPQQDHLHIDVVNEEQSANFLVILNKDQAAHSFRVQSNADNGQIRGIFTQQVFNINDKIEVPGDLADIFEVL